MLIGDQLIDNGVGGGDTSSVKSNFIRLIIICIFYLYQYNCVYICVEQMSSAISNTWLIINNSLIQINFVHLLLCLILGIIIFYVFYPSIVHLLWHWHHCFKWSWVWIVSYGMIFYHLCSRLCQKHLILILLCWLSNMGR